MPRKLINGLDLPFPREIEKRSNRPVGSVSNTNSSSSSASIPGICGWDGRGLRTWEAFLEDFLVDEKIGKVSISLSSYS